MAARASCFEQLGLSHLQRRDLVLENVRVDGTSKLGSGAYGTVYKATWQGVHVAAKVLHEILIDTDVVGEEGRTLKLREFGREVQKLCQLHHPNLTQLLGVAEVDGQPALVVELMSCTLLRCSVGPHREYEVRLLGYLSDTAAGLRYLHGQGLMHRDLTPNNVLIRAGCAKLCDFGVSAFLGRDDPAARIRQSVARTPGPGALLYMPPEALVEPAVYDQALDIFSFGVLAVSVLSGREPSVELMRLPRSERVLSSDGRTFNDQPILETMRRSNDIRQVSDEHPLKDLLLACVSNDPAARPTAAVLHDRLTSVAWLARHVNKVSDQVVVRDVMLVFINKTKNNALFQSLNPV